MQEVIKKLSFYINIVHTKKNVWHINTIMGHVRRITLTGNCLFTMTCIYVDYLENNIHVSIFNLMGTNIQPLHFPIVCPIYDLNSAAAASNDDDDANSSKRYMREGREMYVEKCC